MAAATSGVEPPTTPSISYRQFYEVRVCVCVFCAAVGEGFWNLDINFIGLRCLLLLAGLGGGGWGKCI
jgi:hypothetical protein